MSNTQTETTQRDNMAAP